MAGTPHVRKNKVPLSSDHTLGNMQTVECSYQEKPESEEDCVVNSSARQSSQVGQCHTSSALPPEQSIWPTVSHMGLWQRQVEWGRQSPVNSRKVTLKDWRFLWLWLLSEVTQPFQTELC